MNRLLVAMALAAAAGCGGGSTAPTGGSDKAKMTTPQPGGVKTPPKPPPLPK
jgi:hypothetical protein